ncbi:MAG: HAMP domain-containing histidine kinase [Ruminococcus sp.]|nr:HAMP domain-containing histidine kinase [Ruminococcus sp.]
MEWKGIILFAICLCLLAMVAGMLRRIKKINETLEEIMDGNLDRRIVIDPRSPFSDLCYKINQIMMDNKERRIQAERLERRNNELMTSLSHDIRTPLTSIIGNLDAIHYQYMNEEASVDSVESAREKAYVLKCYLDDLFQWFKLNSREERVELKPVDLVEETRIIFANWISAFEEKGILYDFVSDQEEIYADIDKIFYERAIHNLLKNVLEHSEAAQVCIELKQMDGKVIIQVCDNGRGIPKEEIPFVFDRLYKGDSARNSRGNGFGLAITKELIQLQKGEIFVKTIRGQGTKFFIVFAQNSISQ